MHQVIATPAPTFSVANHNTPLERGLIVFRGFAELAIAFNVKALTKQQHNVVIALFLIVRNHLIKHQRVRVNRRHVTRCFITIMHPLFQQVTQGLFVLGIFQKHFQLGHFNHRLKRGVHGLTQLPDCGTKQFIWIEPLNMPQIHKPIRIR